MAANQHAKRNARQATTESLPADQCMPWREAVLRFAAAGIAPPQWPRAFERSPCSDKLAERVSEQRQESLLYRLSHYDFNDRRLRLIPKSVADRVLSEVASRVQILEKDRREATLGEQPYEAGRLVAASDLSIALLGSVAARLSSGTVSEKEANDLAQEALRALPPVLSYDEARAKTDEIRAARSADVDDPIAHALEPLRALPPSIASDADFARALRETGASIAALSGAKRHVARLAALDRVSDLRPELSEAEAERMLAAAIADAEPEWPEPIPLRTHGDLPAFPVEALPAWLGDWVVAEARATQTPPDMAATLGLAVVSTCCARRFRLCVRDGWYEPANMYTCVVLPPGNRKSAVFSDARAPIDAYEREQAELLAPETRDTLAGLRVAEKRRDEAERMASKASGPNRMLAEQEVREANAAVDSAKRAVVRAPRLTCGDATQEGLARLLAEHGERMAVFDAEGCGPIALMLGRYADGAASVDLYLRGHAGDAYRSDRATRDPIKLDAPTITLALTVQPEVLRQLGERREMRGLGLLARVLWCVPISTVGRREARPTPMPEHVRAAYERNVRRLLALRPADDGAPHTVRLSGAGDDAMADFQARLEPRLGNGGDLSHVADWAAKLPGAVARIAGLLHVAQHPDTPAAVELSAHMVRRAIAIGDYLLAHARAALGEMGADPVLADAEHVLAWLRAPEVRTIPRREVHRGMQTRFARAADMDPVLAVLAERGWIRMREVRARGAVPRSVPHIDVSPHLHDTHDVRDTWAPSVTSVTSVSGSEVVL